MPFDSSLRNREVEPVFTAFANLDETAQEKLRDLCYPLEYRAGDLLCKVDMPPIGVFVIGQGMIRYGKVLACGLRPPVLRILGPGDLLGIEALFQEAASPSNHFARAMTNVQACFIPFDPLMRFLERHPEALHCVTTHLVRQLHRYECRLAEWTCGSVKVNVARLLLCLDARFGQPSPAGRVLTISRQDLADLSTIHIDTMSRVLSQFKSNGWIETGPHHITLRNSAELAQAAAPLPSCLMPEPQQAETPQEQPITP